MLSILAVKIKTPGSPERVWGSVMVEAAGVVDIRTHRSQHVGNIDDCIGVTVSFLCSMYQ